MSAVGATLAAVETQRTLQRALGEAARLGPGAAQDAVLDSLGALWRARDEAALRLGLEQLERVWGDGEAAAPAAHEDVSPEPADDRAVDAVADDTCDDVRRGTASGSAVAPPGVEGPCEIDEQLVTEAAAEAGNQEDAGTSGTATPVFVAPGPAPLSVDAGPPPQPADAAPHPAASVPRRPPISTPPSRSSLDALVDKFHGTAPSAPEPTLPLVALGAPALPVGYAGSIAALDAIELVARSCAGWDRHPPELQRLMVEHVAARCRMIQDDAGLPEASRRIPAIFSALKALTARTRCGVVHGMRRADTPRGASWFADAEATWVRLHPAAPEPLQARADRALTQLRTQLEALDDEPDADWLVAAIETAVRAGVGPKDPRLVKLAGPFVDALPTRGKLGTLRKAIQASQAAEDRDDEATSSAVPAGWPYRHHTEGKRAILLGGSPREAGRQALLRAFGFASLEWVDPAPRLDVAVAQRVRAGSIDLVILLHRFMQHRVSERLVPVCKEAGVPFVGVDRGYGPGGVRVAIERYLPPG